MAPALALASTSAAVVASSSFSAVPWSLDLAEDPTDWSLDDFKPLRDLDSSLRCEICSGIFVAPVSVKECNHTFCSSCVRESINSGDSTSWGQQCPKCKRKGVFDSHLVPNVALEAASQAWRLARPKLAELQKVERARKEAQAARDTRSSTPASPRAIPAKPRSPKPSSEATVAHEAEAESSTGGRVLRSRSKRGRAEGDSAASPYVVPDSDEDEDGDATWMEGGDEASSSKRAKKAATPQPPSASTSPKKSPAKGDGDYKNIAPDEMVDCPICSHSFTNIALQRHLDKGGCSPGCPPPSDKERGIIAPIPPSTLGVGGSQLRNGAKGAAWFSRAGPSAAADGAPPAKLKRPQYDLLKDREITKLLGDARLKTLGTRERLISRHRHWVNLCNANMDASEKNRKSEKALRKEMEQWERTRDDGERVKQTGGPISEKKLQGWETRNKAQFQELIQQARSGHRKNAETHQRKQGEEVGEDKAQGEDAPPSAGALSSSLSSAGTMGPPSQVGAAATAAATQPSNSSASNSGAEDPPSSMQLDDAATDPKRSDTDDILLDGDALEQELSQA